MKKVDFSDIRNLDVLDNFKKLGMYDIFFQVIKEKTQLSDDQVHKLIEHKAIKAEEFKKNVIESAANEDVENILNKISEDNQVK